MEAFSQSLALAAAGMALGWTAYFSFQAAPQAFRDLDHGRANRYVRNAMKTGHPLVAALCWVAGGAALFGGAIAGAVTLALAGALFMLARWTLAPRDDPRPAGARRVLSTARVVAAGLTATMMLLILGAIVLIGLKV